MNFQERLAELNRRGLIHAPEESENHFFVRCRQSAPAESASPSPLAKRLFDIDPDWVYVHYDSKGLRLWEGGCTWIQEAHVSLQLHPAFQKKGNYFGYTQEEVMAHELVHAARSGFEEPIFEEMLAYQTASSPFRRFWGPLLRTANESLFFIFVLVACVCAAFFEPMAWMGTLTLFGGAIGRLLWTQRLFNQTRQHLSTLVGPDKALAAMLRLTDREIIRFAKMDHSEIAAYAARMAKTHFRWQQITTAYFPSL